MEDTTDIREVLSGNTTPAPEEAAQNLSRAKLFDLEPDAYSDLKSELDPKASAVERIPATVDPVTKDFVTQSKQHLAATQDDIPQLDDTVNRLRYYQNKLFTEPNLRRQRNELSRKMMENNGKLEDGDKEMLMQMNSSLNEMSMKAPDDMGKFEKWGAAVGGAAVDIARSYWENKELVGASTVTGGVLGAIGGFIGTMGNPAGAVAGFKIGAGPGLAFAATAVPFVDAYVQSRDSLYNDLSFATDDKTGEPINLTETRKQTVSRGVALISGAAAAYAGKVFASNNPFLRKFADPTAAAKYVISNPALMAKLDLIGGIVKSGGGEAFEEGVQQLTETIATELGKVDGSEESFMNALDNIGVTNLENAKKNVGDVLYSASVGFGAGTSFATVTNTPTYKSVRDEYVTIKEKSEQKKAVLEHQNMMMEANEVMKTTKVQNLAPDEARTFKKQLFEKLGFDPDAWFTSEDIEKFSSSDPKKASRLQSILEVNPDLVKLANDTNTPVKLSKADVLDIMTEFPEFSDYMRLTPDGQNPLDVRNEAKNFVENLSKAEKTRTAILEKTGMVENVEATKGALTEALGDLADSPYFDSEAEYLDRAPFKESPGLFTAKEAEEFNTAHLSARLDVAKSLKEDVEAEMQGKENEAVKAVGELKTLTVKEFGRDVTLDFDQIESDMKVVEGFTNRRANNQFTRDLKNSHMEVGNFSTFAIDPRFLPDELRPHLTADPVLTDRKVFAVGGISPDEAAVFLGVESGEQLLKILSRTPDKKTYLKRKQQAKIELRNQVRQGFKETRLQAREDAFTKMSTVHLREMKHMYGKELPTQKRGIIKIAKKLPSIPEVNAKAQGIVKGMKIRDINPNVFKYGEARSQRTAVKQAVNAEWEQALANKEKAILNTELMRESMNAKDKVSSYEKFWKKMSSPSAVQTLKDAGLFDKMNEFMSVYKLSGNIRDVSEKAGFANWVKKQVANGENPPVIPDRLNDMQSSFKDLTVEQYQAITEMGQFLYQKAKDKNKMLSAQKERAEIRTHERIAEQIDLHARSNPDFDESRIKAEEKTSKDADFVTNVHNKVKTLVTSVTNAKNIIFELDGFQHNGFFYKTFIDPLVQAQTGKREDMFQLRDHFKKTIEESYGDQKSYNKMVNTRLDIPEFAGIDTLNNGNLRKIDVMRLMAIIGDENGRERISNFVDADNIPLEFDTVMKVLDREIDENDAKFVHNFFVLPFKKFEGSARDLQLRTTGVDPEMVKGAPFVHRGKVYEGGYQPLMYQRLSDADRAAMEVDEMTEQGTFGNEDAFFARMRSAEMTKQDRLKDRTGSKRPLKLDFEDHFNALEDVVHDIHFRETGIDLMKIMRSASNVKNMKAVIGAKKFVLLLDSVKDVVSKASDKDSVLYREQNSMLNQALGYTKSLHAVKTIAYNVMSAAIQWDSLLYMPLRSGAKTFGYMGQTLAKFSANPMAYNDMVKIAADILPDIKYEQDGIDDSVTRDSEEFIPHGQTFFENYKKLGEGVTRLKQIRRKAIQNSFFLLREADKFNKVVAVHSLSNQFLNGDIQGYSKELIDSMSDTEKKETMQKVVKQIVDLSLTASSRLDKTALEKNKLAQVFVNYWADRRSRLNTIAAQTSKAKRSVKAGEYNQAAQQLALLAVVSGASVAFQNAIRGDDESLLKKAQKVDDLDSAGDFALDTMFDFAKAPVTQFAQSIPGVDAMLYAYDSTRDYGQGKQVRPVTVPVLGVATDIVAGVNAMTNLLNAGLSLKRTTKKDRKALVITAGYAMGGAPSNMINKLIDIAGSRKVDRVAKDVLDDIKNLNGLIKDYSEEFKDEPEAKEFIEDLKEYQKTLPQDDAKNVIPENTKSTLKSALSGDDWTKFNEDTGAVGIYQFTDERWRELMDAHPDLGLTEEGRLAKDPAQQEKAMDATLDESVKTFSAYGIEINEANLLGAHEFGMNTFIAIQEGEDGQKLSEAIGAEANRPEFKKFSTVGEVKSYLKRKVKKD